MVKCDTELEGVRQVSVLVCKAHELSMEVAAGDVTQLLSTQEALLYRTQHVRYVPRHIAAFLRNTSTI